MKLSHCSGSCGTPLKEEMRVVLEVQGHEVIDLGAFNPNRQIIPTSPRLSAKPCRRGRQNVESLSAAAGWEFAWQRTKCPAFVRPCANDPTPPIRVSNTTR